MLFDGRAFATERRAHLIDQRQFFGELSLGIVAATGDPVTDSYVRIKEKNASQLNIELKRYVVDVESDTEEVIRLVREASVCDGVIVQLPLPAHIDTKAVLEALPPQKDVDGLSLSPKVLPPVVAAIKNILEKEHISIQGKRVVVVGKGRLVGAPSLEFFQNNGAEVSGLEKGDELSPYTEGADIVVLGAGAPGILTADMVKDGVVVFDAGTSEDGGVVVGDAHPLVAQKALLMTPVPGGIGPVAVVEIFGNLFKLLENKKSTLPSA